MQLSAVEICVGDCVAASSVLTDDVTNCIEICERDNSFSNSLILSVLAILLLFGLTQALKMIKPKCLLHLRRPKR